jgi:hypothetical protein
MQMKLDNEKTQLYGQCQDIPFGTLRERVCHIPERSLPVGLNGIPRSD